MTETMHETTAKVKDLQPDEKPNLSLVTGSHEVNQILEHIGVDHDPDSIVREDSYHALFVDVGEGEYTEVWGCHYSVPHLHYTVYKLV